MLSPLFYLQAIALSLSQIWANKTRSFLTTLGIIIAVAAVTSVIASFTGMKNSVLGIVETFGANKMLIFPDRPNGEPRNKYPWRTVRLKQTELVELDRSCPSIETMTPITDFGVNIESRNETLEGMSATGIWPGWHDIQRRSVLIGRPFTRIDEEARRQVCLVNEAAIAELALPSDPTGEHLRLNGRRFLIVGVVETLEASIFGANTAASEIFVPFSTAARMQSEEFFFRIEAMLKSPELAEEAKAEVKYVLRKMRGIGPDDRDTFRAESLDQLIDQFKAIAGVLTAVAGCIVGISLVVGGIGIMNIMLVSVSERTREIGLRKAVGATPSAILMQFLLEAVTLCFVGGAIGIVGGQAFAVLGTLGLRAKEIDVTLAVPLWAIVMSFAFSAVVGVVFGMFPAIKASRLDPIEALRHE